MAGSLSPGESVTFQGVAESLGTSIMPAREAIKRLVSERALEMPNSRSIRVPIMTRQRVQEVAHLRILLESDAVALAAKQCKPADIHNFNALNDRIIRLKKRAEIRPLFEANSEFHLTVYRSSGNKLLYSLIEDLWVLSGPYLSLIINEAEGTKFQFPIEQHSVLIKAIKNGDSSAARRAIKTEISEGFELYIKKVDQLNK